MSVKDRYGNNIRRGDRVADLRPDYPKKEGKVVGTYGLQAIVEWDDGEEESMRATDVTVADKRFGARRHGA